MIRLAMVAMLLGAMSFVGCTNTVRGLGADLNSSTLQNYNRDETGPSYNVRTDMEVDSDLGIDYESRTATEVD